MRESIDASSDFDPNASLVHLLHEVILFYDVLWEYAYWHLHVFVSIHWCALVNFFFMSRHIYFAFFVLNMLFHKNFDVVMSAVLVVNSPGCIMRLPPAVILTLFGSSFCGRWSMTMLAYVTTLSFGISWILSGLSIISVFVPLAPVLLSPCVNPPHYFPKPVSQITPNISVLQ